MKTSLPRIMTYGLVLIGLFSACKTLNNDVTHEQMVAQKASADARKLVTESDFKTCKEGHREKLENQVTMKNNLWGKTKVKRGNVELCIFKEGENCGWEWKIDNSASGVIGYPALEIGRTPWGGKKRKNSGGFPLLVSEIDALDVSYNFETHVKHRKYNLAFDIWLTDVSQADNKNITTEIMIWEDYFDFSSYGKVIESILTPFGRYKVYKGYLKNDKFAQDWVYIAFVRESPRSEGKVDVKHFMDYLLENEHVSPTDYFASLELGNEIGNSSGITLVKEFEWKLKKKS
ncbi:hypothetical protein POV27_08690 [Aureisphaera galaxeae]|uniref:GH12 family glycosyl hydrolase domain-containing protein n=1 Tax=Aureisphaera galaxeae TaxID=1538023 RepID=UPI00234FF4C7|nr:hypothetical protein [Aureisphaera galaxeae]MDC8004127.1 hypothetical protein [Aureisphaera galaxeae]